MGDVTETGLLVDPAEVGVDPDAIEALVERARREIESGLLPSCQLALARDGQLVAHLALGDATTDTRYVIFSCTKAIIGATVWQLIGEGKLSPEQRVAEFIPEFASHGKDVITVEQVMTHTSGFPRAPLGAPAWFSREGRLERFAQWKLNWEPGSAFEYHPTSAHWVLAELIARLDGRDYRDSVTARIVEPLGLQRLRVGVPRDEQADVAELVATGEPATAEELRAALGIEEMPVTEVTDEALLGFNDPEVRALGVPGGGGITTAADLALFYQALLHNPDKLWDPEVLADGTGRVRNMLPDALMGIPASRTLGIVVAGEDGNGALRGFGRTNSPRAFGHNGAAGQIAWADPDTGLSFVYCTNGIDAHVLRQARRSVALSSLAAVCAPRSAA